MVKRKLTKIGNSMGVTIPKEILDGMNLTSDSQCQVRIVGPRTLQLQFLDDRDEAVFESIRAFVNEYASDLEELAK